MSTKAKILTLAMLSITLQHGHVLSGNYGSSGSNYSNQGYYNQGQNAGYTNQNQNPSNYQNPGYGQNQDYNYQNPNYNVNVEDVNNRNYSDLNRYNDRANNNQFKDNRDNRERQYNNHEHANKNYRADADATPHSYPLNDDTNYRNNDKNGRRQDDRDDTAYNNRYQNNQNNQNRQYLSDNTVAPTTNPNAVNQRPVTPDQNNVAVKGTVVEVLSADPSFSTLVQAIKAAGLVEALNGKGPFTIFAPNNQAFQKLPADKWAELMKPENKDKLAAILKYHVIPGKVLASNLVSAKVNSIQGKALDLKVNGSKATVNNANVIKADLVGTNGIVHVVDTVLIPN